jgi:hypothetical protein
MKDQMTEDFVNKVRAKIGPTYDLSRVVYEHSRRKVHVICPKHGDKYPEASELLRGRVCRECGIESRKRPMRAFKDDATRVHAGKYNYDHLVSVKNNREKFTLVCPEHGSFQINMLKHLQGRGCAQCGVARRSRGRLLDQVTAIAQLEKTKLGDYDFSEFVYTGGQKKGWVTCRKHQHRFAMTYANLTCGHGCPRCGHEKNLAGAVARGIAGTKSLAGAKWTVSTPEGLAKVGSSWEVLVYRWLITRYSDTQTQKHVVVGDRVYMADFYIPSRDVYIEVKGREISVGQEAKRATLTNVVMLRSTDMKAIFGMRWYMPKTWGRTLDQKQRNEKLNTVDLGVLPDVDVWLRSKGF